MIYDNGIGLVGKKGRLSKYSLFITAYTLENATLQIVVASRFAFVLLLLGKNREAEW